MEAAKLRQLISDKNDKLERDTLRTAEIIIEGIVKEQKEIARCTENIALLRKELTELEVTQLDPAAILG